MPFGWTGRVPKGNPNQPAAFQLIIRNGMTLDFAANLQKLRRPVFFPHDTSRSFIGIYICSWFGGLGVDVFEACVFQGHEKLFWAADRIARIFRVALWMRAGRAISRFRCGYRLSE